jgi:cytochrome c553
MRHGTRVALCVVGFAIGCRLAALVLADDTRPAEDAQSPAGLKLFNDQVHAILISKCVKCHGGQKTESGFSLIDREALLKGGDLGADVVPGKGKESPLVAFLRHEDEPHMPKDAAKLSDDEIASVAAWIDAGAPYSTALSAKAAPQGHATVTKTDRQFWSFQPLTDAAPPEVNDANWCRTAIDRFVLAKLEVKGIVPNTPADRRKLIRRAYFDLLGLPPSPEEIDAFVNDSAADAYERLIDRLLENPHYGERWGRYWLDVARFAESHGYEQDYDRKHAYHYRDFVIKALNSDLPYDAFVRWQIAGDEIAPDDPEAWMATGFLAAGTHATQITANQAEKERYDELDDQAATIGTAFLGLTVGCARCHDHKYDPIPTRDYYRLISTFTTTVRSDYPVITNAAEYRPQKEAFDHEHAPLAAALDDYEHATIQPRLQALLGGKSALKLWAWLPSIPATVAFTGVETWLRASDPQYRQLALQVFEHTLKAPQAKTVKALVCSEGLPAVRLHTQGPDFYETTYFLQRGDLNQKLDEAPPGFLQILTRDGADESRWRESPPDDSRTPLRRTGLANWITDTQCGAGQLLARVIVNRLWQHHFGRGIVATPSDFGAQGLRPTHPELLDWLARQLVAGGWRLKPLHKLIMTSAVYMESTDYHADRAKLDPDNLLCWRRTRERLEAEVIRDAMLAASGTLDETMFGPGSLDEAQSRRSIYFTIKRSKMIPLLALFDAPDSLQGVGQRPITTVAPQALWMMNNPQVRKYASAFAARLKDAAGKSLADAVQRAYRIALGRDPTEKEQSQSVAFLDAQIDSYKQSGKGESEAQTAALSSLCQALFSLNEFIYVE